jgi:hypothetical protein
MFLLRANEFEYTDKNKKMQENSEKKMFSYSPAQIALVALSALRNIFLK